MFRKIYVFVTMLATSTMLQAAGDDFSSLTDAGTTSKNVSIAVAKNWIWIFAYLPLMLAGYLAWITYDKLTQKEANSQEVTKLSKWTKIIGAFIFGILLSFVLYGVWGKVFAGLPNFSDGWTKIVSDYFRQFFGGTTGTI